MLFISFNTTVMYYDTFIKIKDMASPGTHNVHPRLESMLKKQGMFTEKQTVSEASWVSESYHMRKH